MKQVDFKYEPQQFVKIIVYGLNYDGRVMRCEYSSFGIGYWVEYCVDGKIEQKAFSEDEIE